MKTLELNIPPIVVFLCGLVMAHWLQNIAPILTVALPLPRLVFFLCFLLAGIFGLGGVYEFRKKKTTVHPVKVYKAARLVDSGIYKVTRNPMYLGLFLLLFGYGYWLQNLLSLATCFGFMVYINKLQIKPEEEALEQKFNGSYADYKKRVRRWI